MYYTYMIRCEGNSLYTGYTNDFEKRMKAHFGKSKVAAKYTKSHKPVKKVKYNYCLKMSNMLV